MKNVHGHEVLEMMLSSGKLYTRATLEADIIARFGADAQFHTCSAENLTAAGLIEFLGARGKLAEQTGGLQATGLCEH